MSIIFKSKKWENEFLKVIVPLFGVDILMKGNYLLKEKNECYPTLLKRFPSFINYEETFMYLFKF